MLALPDRTASVTDTTCLPKGAFMCAARGEALLLQRTSRHFCMTNE
jgi:hypothetical protein